MKKFFIRTTNYFFLVVLRIFFFTSSVKNCFFIVLIIIFLRCNLFIFFDLQYIAGLWLTGTGFSAFTMAVIPDF